METLLIRDEGAVRVITLNRPDALHAFNNQMFDELTDAFIDADADSGVKTLVVTGAGRAFSAGADLQEMGRAAEKPKHGFQGMMHTMIDFQKPWFVAINGLGVGIGATMAGLADFVFMAEDARLRCPFSALGLTAEAASTSTFPQLMGRQRATWFLLAAEWMSARECLESGLAMEVLAADALMPRVMEQAAKLAALPSASLTTTRSLILAPQRDALHARVDAENAALAELQKGPANHEALAAFREKRSADFTGM